MIHTIIAAVSIAVALILGFLAVFLPPENIHFVILISRFFEVMIPILAVGALIKYLCSCYKDVDIVRDREIVRDRIRDTDRI